MRKRVHMSVQILKSFTFVHMSVQILKSFTFVPQPKFNGDPLLIKRERCLITDAPPFQFMSLWRRVE